VQPHEAVAAGVARLVVRAGNVPVEGHPRRAAAAPPCRISHPGTRRSHLRLCDRQRAGHRRGRRPSDARDRRPAARTRSDRGTRHSAGDVPVQDRGKRPAAAQDVACRTGQRPATAGVRADPQKRSIGAHPARTLTQRTAPLRSGE
jgi:hypothetical protein